MITFRIPTVATAERFQLDLFVPGTSWEGLFDRLEVWRSRGTALGPYEPLHDIGAMPARLPLSAEDPPIVVADGPSIPLNGKLLQLLVNERVPINVTFSGTDPMTYAQAAVQIIVQSQNYLTAYVVGAVLVVQTVGVGLKTSLRVSGGDAAPLLGLPTSELGGLAFGRDARFVLTHGVEDYSLLDPHGSSEFFYKARFFHSVAYVASQFSSPFQGRPLVGLPTSALCRCYVDLVDLAGEPATNQEMLVFGRFEGLMVGGKTVVGGSVRLLTDEAGHAEALLPRGLNISVAIGGTTLVRDLVVPTDPAAESINMLGPSGTNDVFTVQVPNIPYAVRRSL
jgi:hypothetical protein